MTKVYIVRHAEAEGNIYRRIHGHYDGKVTPNGRLQIAELKKRFESVPLDAVYSSDLTRAYETALGVGEAAGLPVTKLETLRETAMGIWEDTCWGYWEVFDPEQISNYDKEPLKWNVEGSENIIDVQERMVRTVLELSERHDGGSIAVVTHGAALRTLQCRANGIELERVNEIFYCDNTAVSLITVDGGKMNAEYINDNLHLSEEISTFAKQSWWKNKNATDYQNIYFMPLCADEAGIEYITKVYADPDCGFADPEQKEFESFLEAQKRRAAEHPDTLLYAMHYGKPCGLVILSAGHYADAGYVGLFYLEPEFRGKGYAIQLLGVAVSTFRAANIRKIRLLVAENNDPAISFYERNAFVRVPEHDNIMNGVQFLAYEIDI